MSIEANPFLSMDRRAHAEEHQRIANILESEKVAHGEAKRKKGEAEVMKAMKMPKAKMEVIQRPEKMKAQADGAPLMHLEY